MKHRLLPFILFMLSIIVILTACSGTPKHNAQDALITAERTSTFVITRPDVASSTEIDAAVGLRKAIGEKIGFTFDVGTDFYRANNPKFAIPECEILIGHTNRDLSEKYEAMIPRRADWLIAREGNKIFITGKSSLDEAVAYFIEHYVTEDNIYIPDGECYVHIGEYTYDLLTLGSTDFKDMTIYYQRDSESAKTAADSFASRLAADYGWQLSVENLSVTSTSPAPTENGCFYFCTDSTLDPFTVSVKTSAKCVTVSSGMFADITVSVDMLFDEINRNTADKTAKIDMLSLSQTDKKDNLNVADKTFMASLDKKADDMKKAVLSSASEYTAGKAGHIYYFAADGNDGNDGLSPEKPLQSLQKLSTMTLLQGDVVLFRRGDTFRGKITAKSEVTYSAYGEGDKPTICASAKNYADESLWNPTEYPNVWSCRDSLTNVGIIVFDGSGKIGSYEEKLGSLCIAGVKDFTGAKDLKEDLQFWSDLDKNVLYLYSEENPGKRFSSIEIGTSGNAIAVGTATNVTVDNLHITLTGSHGVGAGSCKNLTVRNCIFDWLGGSILKGYNGANVTRYGNAVEVYGSADGYRVYNNWIYQIYDTGITHQFSKTPDTKTNNMKDVEYYGNLIEYCFWSIEYYNASGGTGTTRKTSNVYIHDNFCRMGGYGWGCPGRETGAPMYSLGSMPDVTENYVTENNIFDRCAGYLVSNHGEKSDTVYQFIHNTYVQPYNTKFARLGGKVYKFDVNAASVLKTYLLEDEPQLYFIME